MKGPNGELPSSKLDSLNNLAQFYGSICDDRNVPCVPETDTLIKELLDLTISNRTHPSRIPNPIGDADWTEEDVQNACKHVPLNTALGPDSLHPLFLRHAGPHAISVLIRIFNGIHRTGYVPRSWRDADIVCLFKKGSRTDPNNYRPISLTSVLARMYERMVRHRLVTIIEPYLNRYQFGFRKGRSTLDCLTILQQRIHDALRRKNLKGRRLPVVFLDLIKAFDKVHHPSLLYKLGALCGVTGKLWCFINGFLMDRRARTTHGDLRSEWVPMRCGVPQGSVLGPILFLCYINDLLDYIQLQTNCDPCAFADDLALIPQLPTRSVHCTIKEPDEAVKHALDICGRWAQHWRLTFNVGTEKSAILMFRLQGSSTQFQTDLVFRLPIANNQHLILPYTDSYKYLGIWFHATNNNKKQFEHVCAKLRRASFFVTRLMHDMHPRIAIQMSNTVIRSILTYGLAFWQPSPHQLYIFDSCMAIPLRRALGLPSSSHTVSTLASCGIPCARSIMEHSKVQTAVRASFQIADSNPAKAVFKKSLKLRYKQKQNKRTPLAAHVQNLVSSGSWGNPFVGIESFNHDKDSNGEGDPKLVNHHLTELRAVRGFKLWNGNANEVDAWSEKYHSTSAPIKQWYVGNSRKQIVCDPSIHFDDKKTARIRARLRHGRALFNERRHTFHPSSESYSVTPNCSTCNVVESPHHIFFDCVRFDLHRMNLKSWLQHEVWDRIFPPHSLANPPSLPLSVEYLAGGTPSAVNIKSSFRSSWWNITGQFLRNVHELFPF